ncbi:MAG TPA: hypothetical protein PK014_01995 [Thermoanaerobaculia bacterium]|nr:hypothetical protein [Thermoanaerobaculia bacterium]HUM28535.1 hypothetical protein [Thermoanaerobaculia bacterium]HXK66857.1 hypothetical protein [Thermoanaerobaculia bacterium]
MDPSPERSPGVAIPVFAVFNLVFAGLSLLWLLVVAMAVAYGIFMSGDPKSEIFAGVMGSVILLIPSLAALIVYFLAGLGLIRRKAYGFYFHIAGAILAIFTCVGILYTIPAMGFALQPSFKDLFLRR